MRWSDVIERALWTAIQAPAAVAIGDALAGGSVPDEVLIWSAAAGFLLSAVKSIAKDRLEYITSRQSGRHEVP
jgi:hypothetical protein